MTIDRRNLLKAGLLSLPFLGLGRSLSAIASAANRSPALLGERRMLTIFLRGGNDGLNVVIPHGDPFYASLRPVLKITPSQSLAIPGYGDVRLHPKLGSVQQLMQAQGNVALLHRIGNFACERSHFTEMHLVETGLALYSATAEGWAPQLIPHLVGSVPMPAMSVSDRLQRMFLSAGQGKAATHVQKAYASAVAGVRHLAVPFAADVPGNRVAEAVTTASLASVPYGASLTPVGSYLRSSIADGIMDLDVLRTNMASIAHDENSFPANPGVSHPANVTWAVGKYAEFFERLEEGVAYLNGPPSQTFPFARMVGLELGGWDTHADQAARHDELLAVLDHALKSAHDALAAGSVPGPFLILVVSEFGRTAADNGSGTDHGVGGVAFAIGPTVRGGVYNCSGPGFNQVAGTPSGVESWVPLNQGSGVFLNAVKPATDFRVPLIEIAKTFFQLSSSQVAGLASVGTEWNAVQSSPDSKHQPLGFLL